MKVFGNHTEIAEIRGVEGNQRTYLLAIVNFPIKGNPEKVK